MFEGRSVELMATLGAKKTERARGEGCAASAGLLSSLGGASGV